MERLIRLADTLNATTIALIIGVVFYAIARLRKKQRNRQMEDFQRMMKRLDQTNVEITKQADRVSALRRSAKRKRDTD